MLEDIPEPFKEVVTRHPRPSHSTARQSGEGLDSGGLVIPVPDPLASADPAEPPAAHALSGETLPTTRITTAPGPGEVAPPKWWANKPTHQS
jgi:hypothetical protein